MWGPISRQNLLPLPVLIYNLSYAKNIVFDNPQPTIGVEYTTKCILLKNGEGIVKAQIWDTGYKNQIIFLFNYNHMTNCTFKIDQYFSKLMGNFQ
jgi:hypothetical protein